MNRSSITLGLMSVGVLDPILWLHVLGGAVALAGGAGALLARKGSLWHVRAGVLFVAGMVVLGVPGTVLSWVTEKPFDVLSGLLACYMAVSALLAFRPVPAWGRGALMALGAGCLVGYLGVEGYALMTGIRATDAPPGMGYVFAAILAAALYGDVRAHRQARSRQQTLLRHLWRMNFGLFMATASFFGARPHLFPDWMQAYGVLALLTFLPLLAMAYWAWRVRRQGAAAVR